MIEESAQATPDLGPVPESLTGDTAAAGAAGAGAADQPGHRRPRRRRPPGHVDDGVAFVRMGGGCAGCGMATVTLDQGIELAIRQAVPEITGIVDVTDHAAGQNPYYAPTA